MAIYFYTAQVIMMFCFNCLFQSGALIKIKGPCWRAAKFVMSIGSCEDKTQSRDNGKLTVNFWLYTAEYSWKRHGPYTSNTSDIKADYFVKLQLAEEAGLDPVPCSLMKWEPSSHGSTRKLIIIIPTLQYNTLPISPNRT